MEGKYCTLVVVAKMFPAIVHSRALHSFPLLSYCKRQETEQGPLSCMVAGSVEHVIL